MSIKFEKIKQKIFSIDSNKYWGDDFDVRFYLILKLKKLKNKFILDLGGGIGIISSELDESNFRINLDTSLEDLKRSKNKINSNIENVCASMTKLPFIKNSFDCVICSHVIEVGKLLDLQQEKMIIENKIKHYPTVDETLSEVNEVLKTKGQFYLTTPNNSYYRSSKFEYLELKNLLSNYFSNFSIAFYNTYPRLSTKYRKLNLANVIPKVISKFKSWEKTIISLKQDYSKNKQSVSFYIEATKD